MERRGGRSPRTSAPHERRAGSRAPAWAPRAPQDTPSTDAQQSETRARFQLLRLGLGGQAGRELAGGSHPTRSCREPSSAPRGPHMTARWGSTLTRGRWDDLQRCTWSPFILFQDCGSGAVFFPFLVQRTSLSENLINTGFSPQDIESL